MSGGHDGRPKPGRWQEAGRALYRQAHAARQAGQNAEARRLMLEAVARLGTIALPQAWYEAADWAWDDGDHDVAGRLYHDAMFKTGGADADAPTLVQRLRSIGDAHSHPWVWTALMRASLGEDDGLTPQQRMRGIEALYERTGALPAALRIRARARERGGDLAGASADLDAYLAQVPDPRAQVWRQQLNHAMGLPVDVEGIEWAEHRDFGGGDYYSAGCEFAELVETLQQEEHRYKGSADFARARAVEARAYLLGAARFEHYFATGEGGPSDADPHIYAMLCNNLGITGFFNQEQYAGAIAWHEKGWAASPFWEQYFSRLRCQVRTGQWEGAIDSWRVLQQAFGDDWPAEEAAYEAAWAFARAGQPAQVLEIFSSGASGVHRPLERLIGDNAAETRRVGFMALAASAAAQLGQRALVEGLSRELLASDRLSEGLCQRLAQAWRVLGDETQAARCAGALSGDSPQRPATPHSDTPDVATLLRWAASAGLPGYGLTLPPAGPGDWQFELTRDGQLEGDKTLPLYVQMQQGDAEGAPLWHLGVLNEPPGLLGRWRGKGAGQRLYLAHSPTGHAAPAEWTELRPAQLPPVWAALQVRVDEAIAAWERLGGTVTVARIRETIAQLRDCGLADRQDIDIGTCRIGPGSNAAGGIFFSLTVDRTLDTDPTLPALAFDPFHFIYHLVPATDTEPASAIYGFQDGDEKGHRIEAGDTALATEAARLFERAMKRFARWVGEARP